jgi:ribonucleoside-diphosphate reductase alpha subunit
MEVITRSGKHEKVSFDKVIYRLTPLCEDLDNKYVDPILIALDTIKSMYNGITTQQLDNLSADICASKISQHPDFNKLAARIAVSNLHKETKADYKDVVSELNEIGLISEGYYKFVMEHSETLQAMIDYNRDFLFDFFGFKTLERSYLMRNKSGGKNRVVERPQHLWMRVAVQIHGLHPDADKDINLTLTNIKETYDGMSQQYFTQATPTLFNSGTKRPQLSSCFLLGIDDNIEHIFKTIGDIALISKLSGGIGIHITDIRSKGSLIRSTNGESDGIIPLCKTMESVGRYINQGGKRNGSIACYLEPWHSDIFEFVELRKNTGDENLRARDLFLALWIPDLFMKRIQNNEMWSLMCPDKCPGLSDAYGEKFEKLYEQYEAEGRYNKQVKATDLWRHILESQIETGMPYISYKDHVNRKSNQKNIGVIKSSNLCNEIVQVSNTQETAVCNLASICLPKFVENNAYNFGKLREYTKIVTRNLNKVIDVNLYPIPETRYSNMKNRPVGLGVQGLADVYCKLRIPFDSQEALDLNRKIFEHIYFAAIETSCELAQKYGPYEAFLGSPFSQGLLQWHLWGVDKSTLSSELEWDVLVEKVKVYGTRNSLLTAIMPTASTSQIMKNCECIEPYGSNIYVRTTLAGSYTIVNEHLVRDLLSLGLWTNEIYNEILYFNGSVQPIKDIPQHVKDLYKTSFEIKGVDIVKQSVARGPFIDQTQSLNIFQATPDFSKLSSSHFYGWKNGLKTGMYYLRTKPAVDPIKFGLDPLEVKRIREKYSNNSETITSNQSSHTSSVSTPVQEEEAPKVCRLLKPGERREDCLSCGA